MQLSKLKRGNGASISPCIITKVRFALGLTRIRPKNNKRCSKNYWDDVVEIVGTYSHSSLKEIKVTKGLFETLI